MAFLFQLVQAQKDEWWSSALPRVEKLSDQTAGKATKIISDFIALPKITNTLKNETSEMRLRFLDIRRHPDEYQLAVRLSQGNSGGADAYSIKVEVGGKMEIFTLRVGKDFTELSYMRNDKLREIITEHGASKGGEIKYEKFV